MQPKITLKQGTAVKITTLLDENNPTSVKIQIEDPSEKIKVAYADMTQLSPNFYYYVWQSNELTDDYGDYRVTIKAIYGAYTSIEQTYFTLEDIDQSF